MSTNGKPRSVRAVLVALAISGVGHVIHNIAEFPIAILTGWETLLPLGITAGLAIGWWARPSRSLATVLAGWAAVVIVFGGGSVLPLPVFPFVPEQSASHYAAHAVYAVAQLPLLYVGIRLRSGHSR